MKKVMLLSLVLILMVTLVACTSGPITVVLDGAPMKIYYISTTIKEGKVRYEYWISDNSSSGWRLYTDK